MTELEEKLKQLLRVTDDDKEDTNNIKTNFKDWFLLQFTNNDQHTCSSNISCRLEDFAIYFLNTVRQETEVHLKSKEIDSSKCTTPVRAISHVNNERATNTSPAVSRSIKYGNANEPSKGSASLPLDDSLTYAEVSGGLQQLESFEQSFNYSLNSNTSTPVRRTLNPMSSSNHSQTRRPGGNSCNNIASTPNSTERKTRFSSGAVGAASPSLCLGDFLVVNPYSRTNRKTPTNSSSGGGKPKKRVVPTKISNRSNADSNTVFGNKSSFSNENNILKLSGTEIDDKNQCSILEARMSLKLKADEISKELETSVIAESKLIDVANIEENNRNEFASKETTTTLSKPQIDKIRRIIEKIAAIYSTLLDMNFTINLLNELSYLVNLLSANVLENNEQHNTETLVTEIKNLCVQDKCSLEGLKLLRQGENCFYFASCVLKKQQSMLAMLDLKSLNVVLCNEHRLPNDLKLFLKSIYEKKYIEWQQFKKENEFMMMPYHDKSFNNVYYQEDKDSRQNFPSNTEFGAFKSQRDIFYKALKYWESNHLQPYWNFKTEITSKIREIFRLSEHPVNMAHFAELFVSQLLISVNYATSPEEIGVEIDMQKFSKLAQRLVAPSSFSVDYQFPNHQAFFRDFIYEARSLAFLEQLKFVIYAKLISLNDSTLEVITLLNDNEDDYQHENEHQNELIVPAQILSSLQVLAKFLGYISALPFNYSQNGASSDMLTTLDKQQIELRSLVHPNFNFELLLKAAIRQGKLLISLPWMVQYLSMLDNITLQLNSNVAISEILFCLYMEINADQRVFLPSTAFIIRCCLGWLFEAKPILADQYYNFRGNYQQVKINQSKQIDIFYCGPKLDSNDLKVRPILESILNVICPFLAEFRVSIMPAKYAAVKYVSRSGRYRHITTRKTELNISASPQENGAERLNPAEMHAHNSEVQTPMQAEHKLIEAFLHSQNTTTRRLIDFTIERIYKSAIKDAQLQILLPSKSGADKQINDITSENYEEVYNSANCIYERAHLTALKQWDESVPELIKHRITQALDALLPGEPTTDAVVKQTYHHLIRRKTESKVHQWRVNTVTKNFYCSNLEELAEKIIKANKKKQQALTTVASSELSILKSEPSLSNLLDELQYWLHCTSLRPELVPNSSTPIESFLNKFPMSFKNKLPTSLYRVVEVGTVQLLQNLISKHPILVTRSLIKVLQSVWTSKEMQENTTEVRKQCKSLLRKRDTSSNDVGTENSCTKSIPNIFDGLVTAQFIESLGVNTVRFNKLKEVLVAMIRSNVISVSFVNDLFVPIYKHDWDPGVLNEMANLLQSVANETKDCQEDGGSSSDDEVNDKKSNLFMEVLADFARDVDNF